MVSAAAAATSEGCGIWASRPFFKAEAYILFLACDTAEQILMR